MNDFILGKYVHRNTFIHKIDARIKIFIMILLMAAIFVNYGTFISNFVINGLLFIFIFSLIFISKIKIKSIFKSLKLIWITLIFVFLINIFIHTGTYTYILFDINGYPIYLESIFLSVKIFIRVVMLVLLTLVLTSTTKSTDISYAFSWYLAPLRLIKFPVDDVSMVMSLTLRFIPLLLEETNRIKMAQESRGQSFSKGNIFKRLKAFVSLIVPLLISAFSRSIEMADAMEVRGFVSGERRTRYEIHKFTYIDFVSLFTMIGVCAFLYYLAAISGNIDFVEFVFGYKDAITILR